MGIADSYLARFFSVEVPNAEEAHRFVAAVSDNPAVDAAFLKQGDAPPRIHLRAIGERSEPGLVMLSVNSGEQVFPGCRTCDVLPLFSRSSP